MSFHDDTQTDIALFAGSIARLLSVRLSAVSCDHLEATDAETPSETKSKVTKRKGIHIHNIHVSPDPFPSSPEEMKTNLKDYLERRDMHLRRSQIDIPDFCAGSLMAVTRADPHSRSGESRFVGICIARRNKRLGSTFVLRNVIAGEGVERTFELYSPLINQIEVLKLERRRRAKLYYLRDKPLKESTVSAQMKPVPVENPDALPPRNRKRGK